MSGGGGVIWLCPRTIFRVSVQGVHVREVMSKNWDGHIAYICDLKQHACKSIYEDNFKSL